MTERSASTAARLAAEPCHDRSNSPGTPRLVSSEQMPSVQAGMPPASSGYLHSARKRIVDMAAACALLVLLSPALAAIALLVRATSPGPVLFRQRRNGQHLKPFTILKFRSMRSDSGSEWEVRQAARGDDRVTPVGRFLRRTSLDELPQLINVAKGEMSLVGPRPHALVHDEEFARAVPGYRLRFAAKPGISGLAQVSGARGETPTPNHVARRVAYDLTYVRNASLGMDLGILARTLAEVLSSRDAY